MSDVGVATTKGATVQQQQNDKEFVHKKGQKITKLCVCKTTLCLHTSFAKLDFRSLLDVLNVKRCSLNDVVVLHTLVRVEVQLPLVFSHLNSRSKWHQKDSSKLREKLLLMLMLQLIKNKIVWFKLVSISLLKKKKKFFLEVPPFIIIVDEMMLKDDTLCLLITTVSLLILAFLFAISSNLSDKSIEGIVDSHPRLG